MDIFPIWKSTYFFLSGDNAVVRIIAEDGVVIYRARVSRIPDEDYMHVNLNKPCQAYIDSRIVPVDTEDAVYPMDAYEEFVLQQLNESTGVWADIYTFAFKNDWSYEDTDTLSEPINGHAAAGQVVSLSYLVTGNTESVCYDVVCPEPGPTPPPTDIWIMINNAPQHIDYDDNGVSLKYSMSNADRVQVEVYSAATAGGSYHLTSSFILNVEGTMFPKGLTIFLSDSPWTIEPNTGNTYEYYRVIMRYADYPSVYATANFVRDYDDYSIREFTIEALSAGTLYWRTTLERPAGGEELRTLQYSKDRGATWNVLYPRKNLSDASSVEFAEAGQRVIFRGMGSHSFGLYLEDEIGNCAFVGSSNFKAKVYGNIRSLVDVPNSPDIANPNSSYACTFLGLFHYHLETNDWLVDASNLVLPFTTLAYQMYDGLFGHCLSLVSAPALPATTLARSCYHNMFYHCTSLVSAPALPATTLVNGCYESMFEGCTSLTTAPDLLAYLPVDWCYDRMFAGCHSLNYVRCLTEGVVQGTNYTINWLSNTSSTGTFVQRAGVYWMRGVVGIPWNWTIIEE